MGDRWTTIPFPPLDDNGNTLNGKPPDIGTSRNRPLLEHAKQKFTGRPVIQNNSLYPDEPARAERAENPTPASRSVAGETQRAQPSAG